MTSAPLAAGVPGMPAATPLAGARSAGRLVGVDAARGIALFGMFAAHLVDVESSVDWSTPATWWSIVAGRSSVLFAVLAGVSLALMTGRSTPVAGPALAAARRRIAARGAAIAVLGILLMLLETPVAVILTTYGVLFVVVLPALAWGCGVLVSVAVGLALLAYPIASASLEPLAATGPIRQQILYYYPLATFAAYLLVGLAVGRSDLRSPRMLGWLLGGGAALAVVAYSLGELVVPGGRLYENGYPVDFAHAVFSSEPHTSTLVDMAGSVGVALAVIGACGLLARLPLTAIGRIARSPLLVLARVGAMPLSIYSAHLVVIAVLWHSGFLSTLSPAGRAATWAWFVVGACVAALAWGGRSGPLERTLAALGRRATGRAAVAAPPAAALAAPPAAALAAPPSGPAAELAPPGGAAVAPPTGPDTALTPPVGSATAVPAAWPAPRAEERVSPSGHFPRRPRA